MQVYRQNEIIYLEIQESEEQFDDIDMNE